MTRGALYLQAIRGPLVLITVGILFALHQADVINFARTWPLIIIVVGLVKLAERLVAQPTLSGRSIQSMRPRGSITGPLVLILIGSVFLIRSIQPDFQIAQLLAHYWPYFLILWGVVALIEVTVRFLSSGPHSNEWNIRRRMVPGGDGLPDWGDGV